MVKGQLEIVHFVPLALRDVDTFKPLVLKIKNLVDSTEHSIVVMFWHYFLFHVFIAVFKVGLFLFCFRMHAEL